MEVPMKRPLLAVLALALALPALGSLAARSQPPFDEYFLDKALRIDLYQSGDAKDERVTVHQIYEEGIWPESKTGLLPPFDQGRYVLKVYDAASNRLVFLRGFDTMYAEYKTTSPALAGEVRVFERSVRIPLPKRPVLFVVEKRDRRNLLHPVLDRIIDPSDHHIIRERPAAGDAVFELQVTGDPHDKVDFVFVAEGYTAEAKDKFKADAERMTAFLFSVEPYKAMRDRFNVRAVFRPSPEKGMDEPRQRIYRKTVLNASFNAFDLDRYMLIEEDHRMHEIAGQVPYDALIVLVDSPRYGGGSIAFDYCVTTVDHPRSLEVFVHELGHSFGGLADEYYQSEVSYNEFYPKGIEPLEPNITALLDPPNVKWKDLLSPGIGVPTEYGKDRTEALQAEMREARAARDKSLEAAKKRGGAAKELKAIDDKFKTTESALRAKIEAVRREYASLVDKVGVFEGAGYASKGLYRSMIFCIMIGNPKNEFCAVCQKAIAAMIGFFSGGDPGPAGSGR
jgi:IgA Peptidase M64/Peptidase M64 N-terminus